LEKKEKKKKGKKGWSKENVGRKSAAATTGVTFVGTRFKAKGRRKEGKKEGKKKRNDADRAGSQVVPDVFELYQKKEKKKKRGKKGMLRIPLIRHGLPL